MQLELTQRNYMDEDALTYDETRAAGLVAVLRDMLDAAVGALPRRKVARVPP